jgi:predicted N-acetyltransferase YhbS
MQIRTRPLEQRDLDEADRIIRLAFGTFFGLPDPMRMFGDSDMAHTRFRAAPDSALAAEADSKLVGSNFVTNWGSFGFFGPLTVEPRLWDQGVAQRLLEPTMELFEKWDAAIRVSSPLVTVPNISRSIKSSISARDFSRP